MAEPTDFVEVVFDLGLYAIEGITDAAAAYRDIARPEVREEAGNAVVRLYTSDTELADAFGNHALFATAQRSRRA